MNPQPAEWPLWLQEGERLVAAPPLRRRDQATRGAEDPKFALGDFLCTVPIEYLDALATALQTIESGQLRIYREVAEKVPPWARVASPWSVHRELREHLDKLRPGLTLREAMALLGKKPIDSRADRRLTAQQKADKIREWLWDNTVKKVIYDALEANKKDRKWRRVRVVSEDLEAEHRAAEAFKREGIAAKRPYEASVDMQLAMLDTARLICGLIASFDALDPAGRERVTGAFDRLDQQMALAREKIHPPPPSSYNGIPPSDGIVIDGDVFIPAGELE